MRIRLLTAALCLAAGSIVGAQRVGSILVAEESGASLTAQDGSFVFQMPVHAGAESKEATITADLLDPLGGIRSRGTALCRLKQRETVCRVPLPPVTSDSHGSYAEGDDLPLYRVRYTVSAVGADPVNGILAASQIASGLFELHMAVPGQLRPGAAYIARVRAIHPRTHAPQANVPLDVTVTASYLNKDKKDERVGMSHVVTDADGFASISFTAPAGSDISSVDLEVYGRFGNFQLSATQTLDVASAARFDLTTDKPLYQPGQTVHARMLLLDRDAHAEGGKTVRVDISDPDSTLVFRTTAVTSAYGIAAVDWPVPSRMRLGAYSLQAAQPDDPDNYEIASAIVRVSRYDLPTFVVAPHADRPFYLPGTNAVVEVRANYLFGKPVLHGGVRVVRDDDRTWNVAEQRFKEKEGKVVAGELDARGVFRAHIDLHAEEAPYRDHEPSNAFDDVHFAAYVTDASTGRTEQRRFDLRVANQAINVYVISADSAAGLPQQHYVSLTTVDGTPVAGDITVALLPLESSKETAERRLSRAVTLVHTPTDAHGLARIVLPAYEDLVRSRPAPADGAPADVGDEPEILVSARASEGRGGSIVETLREPAGPVRLTTPQTIYRPGEPVAISIDSARPDLPLTVQLLRSTRRGLLLLETRTVTLAHGHAELTVATDGRYAGVVFVQAIALGIEGAGHVGGGGDEDPMTPHASRALLFPRDDRLQVDVRMSAATYAPGSEAWAALTVRGPQDADGDVTQPAPSAVGLVAVDQAVEERDRTDREFGGATSSFFFPSYTDSSGAAGGFTLPALEQLDMAKPLPDGAQLAAEVLLSQANSGIDTTSNMGFQDLANAFRTLIDGVLGPARVALSHYLNDRTELPTTEPEIAELLAAKGIDLHALRDPWGQPYTMSAHSGNGGVRNLVLVSAGPDKQHGTADDFEVNLASWHWFNGHLRQLQHAVDAFHVRTGHYLRTLPELRAEMQAEGVAFDAWRDPWNQPFTYRFSIEQTRFAVNVLTNGDPATIATSAWERGPYAIGAATIDYTLDLRRQLEQALTAYTARHPFPRNEAELQAALRADGVKAGAFVDPWRHRLYATFRSHPFYTDKAHTEAHAAAPGEQPEVRTTYTPVTEVADIVDLRSDGPDGKRGTSDDFTFATVSLVRSQQSAQQSAPQRVEHRRVHAGLGGEVSGVVTDQTGAVIPNVVVTAIDVKTKAEFETVTDRDGQYLFGPLPSGIYRLRFSAPGFEVLVYDQVVVRSTGTAAVDARLAVGAVNESVEVTAGAPMVSTSSASLASVQQVSNLPVNNRSLSSLVQLHPGVALAMQASATPRLRDYFPETLLWRPEIVTAPDGTATEHFPVADNITTWQLSASASTMQGNTGAGVASFTAFQPFFAAFDPPSLLTTGDRIALPVTLRNYLDHSVSVAGSIAAGPWFRMEGPASRTTVVGSQQSASPVFKFAVLAPVTDASVEFTAKATDTGDRIARRVSVHPDGLESAVTNAAILTSGENTFSFFLPPDTMPDGTDATLKIYPNLGAHLRDALAAMAAYPDGCAEQITSIAWPSLLIQRYSASLPQRDDKLQRQTHLYLEEAYQNLLANQLPSGGFAYWTRSPEADIALTAYVVEFLDRAGAFVTVDPKVARNAIAWLAKSQEKDGLWLTLDGKHRQQPQDRRGNAMLTTSVAAMIAGAPGSEPLVRKALAATQGFVTEFDEPYTLASYALASLGLQDTARSQPAIDRLRGMALSENGGAYWSLETNTPFFGSGRAGRVESSAQVLRALLAAGAKPNDDLVARGLLFLDHEQDRQSLWYSTQATARVLDVLAELALQAPAPSTGDTASLSILVDGHARPPVALPPANIDGGPIFVPLGSGLGAGTHAVRLTLPSAAESATAQLVANFYQPWKDAAANDGVTNHERLRLDVGYSSQRPTVGQPVTISAHIERIGFHGYGMLLAEIGLPPGADVDRASLESAMTASDFQIDHYEVLPDRVLFYVSPQAGGLNLRFSFRLRYGIEALTAPSSVYDYYNPDARLDVAPIHIQTR